MSNFVRFGVLKVELGSTLGMPPSNSTRSSKRRAFSLVTAPSNVTAYRFPLLSNTSNRIFLAGITTPASKTPYKFTVHKLKSYGENESGKTPKGGVKRTKSEKSRFFYFTEFTPPPSFQERKKTVYILTLHRKYRGVYFTQKGTKTDKFNKMQDNLQIINN